MQRPPLLSFALCCALLSACDDSSSAPEDAGPARGPDGRKAGWYDEADQSFGTTLLDAGRPIRMADTVKPNAGSSTGSTQRDAGEPDAATSHGEHGSFETAMRIVADGSRLVVDEFDENQVDYFVFTAEAGGFYEIATSNDRFSPDNVLALYDSQQQLLAENDVGSLWPGDLYDTRLVVRVAKAGDYYVRVEDLSTPAEFFNGGGFTLLYYELSVRAVSAATPGFAVAGSPMATIPFYDDTTIGYHYVTVLGEIDQDVETIEFDGLPAQALIAQVHPGGVHGDGSSVSDGLVSVTTREGATLARIDRAAAQNYFRPPIGQGKYRIALERMGERGNNPFFAMDLVMLPDNPAEQHESQNGRLEGAEPLTLSNGDSGRGLLLARVGKGDIDYYRVSAVETQDLRFSCEGESTGSGVRGLNIDIRDQSDKVISSDKEDGSGVELRHRITSAGTYYLRMSSAESSGASADPWVRCAVLLN